MRTWVRFATMAALLASLGACYLPGPRHHDRGDRQHGTSYHDHDRHDRDRDRDHDHGGHHGHGPL